MDRACHGTGRESANSFWHQLQKVKEVNIIAQFILVFFS